MPPPVTDALAAFLANPTTQGLILFFLALLTGLVVSGAKGVWGFGSTQRRELATRDRQLAELTAAHKLALDTLNAEHAIALSKLETQNAKLWRYVERQIAATEALARAAQRVLPS